MTAVSLVIIVSAALGLAGILLGTARHLSPVAALTGYVIAFPAWLVAGALEQAQHRQWFAFADFTFMFLALMRARSITRTRP